MQRDISTISDALIPPTIQSMIIGWSVGLGCVVWNPNKLQGVEIDHFYKIKWIEWNRSEKYRVIWGNWVW